LQQKPNKGILKVDATVADQMIVYPTDHGLLNTAREESEKMIDLLYARLPSLKVKPRTYRRVAKKRTQPKKPYRRKVWSGEERLRFKTNQGKDQRDVRELVCQYLLCHEPGEITADCPNSPHGIGDSLFVLFFAYPKHEQANKRCIWTNKVLQKHFRRTKKPKPEFLF